MYAVVKTGAKQFRVSSGDVIKVEKLDGEAGDTVTLGDVMMIGGDSPEIGAPLVEGASVAAEILEHARDKKIIVFKKRRRQNYRRKKGHRQHYTVLRIDEILTGGAKASGKKAAAKPAKAPAADAAPADTSALDISLIGGVGPKMKAKLADHGIETLEPLAAMDDTTKEKLETAGLLARAEKEEWQEQAKELLAGKAPRSKVDQKAADKA